MERLIKKIDWFLLIWSIFYDQDIKKNWIDFYKYNSLQFVSLIELIKQYSSFNQSNFKLLLNRHATNITRHLYYTQLFLI